MAVPQKIISKICADNLLAIADAYGRATGLTLEQVSWKFYGNRDFLRDFRRGKKTISLKKWDHMYRAFAKAWPKGSDWPMMRSVVFNSPV
jgi:hypothetical protein